MVAESQVNSQFKEWFSNIQLSASEAAGILKVSNDTVKSWLVDPASSRYRNMPRHYLLTIQTHYKLRNLESLNQKNWLLIDNIQWCYAHLQTVIDHLESSKFINPESEMMSLAYKILSALYEADCVLAESNLNLTANTDSNKKGSLASHMQKVLDKDKYLTERDVYHILKTILYFYDGNIFGKKEMKKIKSFTFIAKEAIDRINIEITLIYPNNEMVEDFINKVSDCIFELYDGLSHGCEERSEGMELLEKYRNELQELHCIFASDIQTLILPVEQS